MDAAPVGPRLDRNSRMRSGAPCAALETGLFGAVFRSLCVAFQRGLRVFQDALYVVSRSDCASIAMSPSYHVHVLRSMCCAPWASLAHSIVPPCQGFPARQRTCCTWTKNRTRHACWSAL
eukprot:1198943-Prymnesium_polylepis.2